MKTSTLLSLASATAALASPQILETRQSNWTIGQTVQTSSGPVSGHAAKNDSQVSEYLGIPFGQAPIGELRFAAPVRFNGSSPLNGTNFVSLPSPRRSYTANIDMYRVLRVPSNPARARQSQQMSYRLRMLPVQACQSCR
jgi:hypothetical protein